MLCIHDTEPYASATLVLPPSVREYAARRQKCSDSSSNSGSGCNTRPPGVRSKAGRSGADNAAYSSSGGSGKPGLPKRGQLTLTLLGFSEVFFTLSANKVILVVQLEGA